MKGCKIKKKDRRDPVFVTEVIKTHDRCVPPKMLIMKVHTMPRPAQAVIRLEPLLVPLVLEGPQS